MIAEKTKYTPLQRFWKLLKPDQNDIRNVYLYSIFKGLLSIAMPLGIQAIINFIQGGQISVSWVLLVGIVILSILVNGVMQIYQLRITENLQQKIFARAAFDFAYRIPRIKFDALLKEYAPELMNRFFDIISVQKGLPKILIDFSTAVLHIFFGLVLLSFYHTFFIIFCFFIVILLYVLFRYTMLRGMDTSLLESKHKYKLVHWLEELARSSNLFKLASDSHVSLDKTDQHTNQYLEAREGHFRVLVWQYSFMVAFKVLIASGLLIIGGFLVIEGKMNIGQFVASEIILLLLLNAIEKVILSLDTIYDVLTALEKIGQVTDLELEDTSGIHISEIIDKDGLSVELIDLKYKFPHQEEYAICGIDMKVSEGDRVVLTGLIGEGKDALLNVIAGINEVFEGQLLFNNRPKHSIDLESLRQVTGEYLSDDSLFHGTIYENVEMGRGIGKEDIYRVFEELNLADYIKSLPEGMDTYIGAAGITLPLNVAQKVLIARVVCVQPKLLLLADPFRYLNEVDKKVVVDYLTDETRKWTIVAVTDDAYFKSKCTQDVQVCNGKIDHL